MRASRRETTMVNYSDYEFRTAHDIDDAREQLRFAEEAWLRKQGWEHTSSTPGSYWLWDRDIGGRRVLVDTNMAIKMTRELELQAGVGPD